MLAAAAVPVSMAMRNPFADDLAHQDEAIADNRHDHEEALAPYPSVLGRLPGPSRRRDACEPARPRSSGQDQCGRARADTYVY